MQVRLPDIICDTSFLMYMAAGRIRNMHDTLGFEKLVWIIPEAVVGELTHLAATPSKAEAAGAALSMACTMDRIGMDGPYADDAILSYIRNNGGYVATIDKKLKRAIRGAGGHIVSLHDDCMILEG